MCVCVCLCVCKCKCMCKCVSVSTSIEAINNYSILIKLLLQLFCIFMTLASSTIDGCSLSNKACCECLPKETLC